jgi:glutamate carboxypeptidase
MTAAHEDQITAWLASQHDAMIALLREMVNTDSNSYDKLGIDAVGVVVRRFLAAHDVTVETIPQA